jgi:nitroreductase
MELTEAIMNRRSIRKQKTDPIDDETVRKILEAGRWAPSWANTQTWRFITVRDSKIKDRLADTLRTNNPATDAVRNSPATIVICAEMNRAGFRDGKPATNNEGYWFMFDAGLAMQNICLTAHALGVGTVIVGAFDAKAAGEILEVLEGYCVVAMTPLGIPAEEGRTPTRKELSEIVFNDTFGA